MINIAYDRQCGQIPDGDTVTKRKVVALTGKAGRARGPHVRFEVTKDGNRMNLAPYIHRVIQ